jgi:RND family efflux transporter MFP subunit
MAMKKSSLFWMVVTVAAVVGGGAWWRGKSATGGGAAGPDAGASAPKPAQVVSLAKVQQRDVPVNFEAAGTVLPLNTVEVRPQVSSTVKRIAIQEGQMVRKGDLLFTFDDRPDQANLDKARAQLARDKATLADLDRQWKRAQELRGQNFISQSAADTVLSQVEAQRAAVVADEASLKSAEVALSYGQLKAPLSGRTGQINVNLGSLVAPSTATTTLPLVTISQIDPIGVSFTVPEAQLAALLRGGEAGQGAQGATVTVLLPATPGAGRAAAAGAFAPASAASGVAMAAAPAASGASAPQGSAPTGARESLQGTVSFIDNAVDTASGTIKVKAELANPKRQLWPGQYVTVRLTLRTLKDAAVVPQAALILRGQERSVYVVGEDMVAQLRPVQLRYAAGEFAAVEGLKPGERVVLEGKQNLRPGSIVREATSGPGKGASGAAGGASGAASGGKA